MWSYGDVILGHEGVESSMQGVCRGISLVRGATVPKEKAFFILGPHVTEGVGVRVFVLPDGPAAWEIRRDGMLLSL